MAEENKTKGRICVTGGTGFLGSWIVKRLLEDGYSVNTTTRLDPAPSQALTERKRDISYLTNLPGASERLQIFNADFNKPEGFAAAIEGCDGVFHTAHHVDHDKKESEEAKIKRVIRGVQGILEACLDSKTVKRVVYTSSLSAALFTNGSEVIDESSWTDVDFVRSFGTYLRHYAVTKTLEEKAAFEFAEQHGLDLVSVLPTLITGPFICLHVPYSVHVTLASILRDEQCYTIMKSTSLVHVDDVARAHIHLFEHPNAKGRYLCTGVDTSIDEISEIISAKYPEYQMPTADSWKDSISHKSSGIPPKKLLETGFKYENGLVEMLDGAIKSCRERGYF